MLGKQLFIASLVSISFAFFLHCRMNHPIKRFKANDIERCKTVKQVKYDLYAGQQHGESSGLQNSSNQGQNSNDGVKNEWKSDDMNTKSGKERTESEADKDSNSKNLFTSEGLRPSYNDIDKIFDNSDDNSNDNHVSNIEMEVYAFELMLMISIFFSLSTTHHLVPINQLDIIPTWSSLKTKPKEATK